MIYLLAGIQGVVATFMCFASEITNGNIRHLESGREPNAGAAIFPSIPLLPLLSIGAAWALQKFLPNRSLAVLTGFFLLFGLIWGGSFVRSRARFQRLKKNVASRTVYPSTSFRL
jgi:hypothetical protein